MKLGPKDLLYKPVVDSGGEPVGKVVNLTQNGTGNFDTFGINIDDTATNRINNGRVHPVSQIFLDIDLIETVDSYIRLKKRLDEL